MPSATAWCLAALLALAACAGEPASDAPGAAVSGAAPDTSSARPAARSPSAEEDPSPEEEGRRLVESYYQAIAAGDYPRAHAMWEPEGLSGPSVEALQAEFRDAGQVQASVSGPVEIDGAAGSLYATVPVQVTVGVASGAERRYDGTYTLRRVNHVEGASPSQLRWHITSADLHQTG